MSWKKTKAGYTRKVAGKTATLAKTGKTWSMKFGGKTTDLGRKASFDHADRAIRTAVAAPHNKKISAAKKKLAAGKTVVKAHVRGKTRVKRHTRG